MGKARFVVAWSVCWAVVTLAVAQEPAEPRKEEAPATATAGSQAKPMSPLRKMSMKDLLQLPAVQTELKLTTADRKRLDSIEKELSLQWTRLAQEDQARIEQLRASGDTQALQAAQQELVAAATRGMEEADIARYRILTPAQRTRASQIRLQAEGPLAFDRPEVAERLNLDPDQVETIHALVAETLRRAALPTIVPRRRTAPAAPDPSKAAPKPADSEEAKPDAKPAPKAAAPAKPTVRDQMTQMILSTLTRRQRAAYEKMLGPPFDLARLSETAPAPDAQPKPAASTAKSKSTKPATKSGRRSGR